MNTKRFIILQCMLCFIISFTSKADIKQTPLPCTVTGVNNNSILLNGTWQFDPQPQNEIEKTNYKPKGGWSTILVPGEYAMQGFAIEHDKPVLYRKIFSIPADFTGKSVILRFDGVYSHARLFVNGSFIREHHGGFTRWESDVTSYIKPGKNNEIKLEVTDRKDDISYASGYAHHPIGGILRDVLIYALPKNHINNIKIATELDKNYINASLNLSLSLQHTKPLKIIFSLHDPKGKEVSLSNPSVHVPVGTDTLSHLMQVSNPEKWDAEHPNLYTLHTSCIEEGKEIYSFTRQIGFREIIIKENQLFVNGKPVKLRGACRHDIHPTLGRTTTAEYDSLDAALFKKSNMNFVRTSHYPPTERFLEYCDKMGLYVECETAICFVDTHRQKNYGPANSQNDPAFTNRYLLQLQEMVTSLRNHASILFWSIGNESVYGTNFQLSYDWIKAADTTRPAIFSYPGTVPAEKKAYDIISMHYPGVEGNLNQYGVQVFNYQTTNYPSVFDEWAHVPCYTYSTLQDDPNIREFWGISLDKMWSNLFESRGGLGGAIWGFIDETFMLPTPKVGTPWWIEYSKTAKPAAYTGNCVGYGEWGIIDVWRREKPEFWGTKKAYSPIRVTETNFPAFTSGEKLLVPVYNRFDHTNLSEVTITYTYKGKKGSIVSPQLAPRKKGVFAIPANTWKKGDEVVIEFFTNKNDLIDTYKITLGTTEKVAELATGNSLQVEETPDRIIIKGDNFSIPFMKETGLIKNAVSKGEVIIAEGPFLNLDLNFNHNTGAEVREKAKNYIVKDSDWKKTAFSYEKKNNQMKVLLSGTYQGVSVNFSILINASGEIDINYETQNEPNGWLRESGIKFHMPSTITQIEWNRNSYWSNYPSGHFGAPKGKTYLYNNNVVKYGEEPRQPWEFDTHNYYYFADAGADCNKPLTQIAKGMKENIYSYVLSSEVNKGKLQIVSPTGELACRLNKHKDEQLVLYINNRWDYPEIAWGDYCKELDVTPCYGKITVRL